MDELTAHELRILRRIAAGQHRTETCAEFHISRHTYTSYTKRIRGKLEAKTLANAVYIACQRGLLP